MKKADCRLPIADCRLGFTLMELVTVIGIFGLVSLLILTLHQQTLSLQRRTSEEQKALSDLRYAMEAIASNLRIGTVYYGGWATGNCSLIADAGQSYATKSDLYVIDEDNERVRYSFEKPCRTAFGGGGGCLVKEYFGIKADGRSAHAARLTALALDVVSFRSIIQPICDPYHIGFQDGTDCATDPKRQPVVTMVVGVNVSQRGGGKIVRVVQATVSSRVYRGIEDVCSTP